MVRGQFLTARSELPTVTFNNEKITFNCFYTRKLSKIEYVQLLLHPIERKIAIRPCGERDIFRIPWHRNSKHSLTMKTITCPHFCNALFQIMNWEPDYEYKVLGTLIEREDKQMLVFNLNSAVPSATISEEKTYKKEEKKRKVMICKEECWGSFGDEFYDFGLENALYYVQKNTDLRITEKARPVEGQFSFDLMTKSEIENWAKRIKKRAGDINE